jgi:superfamily II DNA helicase RecQ
MLPIACTFAQRYRAIVILTLLALMKNQVEFNSQLGTETGLLIS